MSEQKANQYPDTVAPGDTSRWAGRNFNGAEVQQWGYALMDKRTGQFGWRLLKRFSVGTMMDAYSEEVSYEPCITRGVYASCGVWLIVSIYDTEGQPDVEYDCVGIWADWPREQNGGCPERLPDAWGLRVAVQTWGTETFAQMHEDDVIVLVPPFVDSDAATLDDDPIPTPEMEGEG